MSFSHLKSTTEIYFLVLLTLFESYQDLLETPSFEKCPLRVYSSRLTTFTSIIMVNSASTSFLTRTYARMYTRLENPYIEVGRAHLKMITHFCIHCQMLRRVSKTHTRFNLTPMLLPHFYCKKFPIPKSPFFWHTL